MKAKINSGGGRQAKTKTATPTKPSRVQLRSGFQAVTSGLNTNSGRGVIPHDRGATGTTHAYGRTTGKRRMY